MSGHVTCTLHIKFIDHAGSLAAAGITRVEQLVHRFRSIFELMAPSLSVDEKLKLAMLGFDRHLQALGVSKSTGPDITRAITEYFCKDGENVSWVLATGTTAPSPVSTGVRLQVGAEATSRSKVPEGKLSYDQFAELHPDDLSKVDLSNFPGVGKATQGEWVFR